MSQTALTQHAKILSDHSVAVVIPVSTATDSNASTLMNAINQMHAWRIGLFLNSGSGNVINFTNEIYVSDIWNLNLIAFIHNLYSENQFNI